MLSESRRGKTQFFREVFSLVLSFFQKRKNAVPQYTTRPVKRQRPAGGRRAEQDGDIQLFSWKLAPQERQVTVICPLPRGTRSRWPQLGHLK